MKKFSDEQLTRFRKSLDYKLNKVENKHFVKVRSIINSIDVKCILDEKSHKYSLDKSADKKKRHPIRPLKGEIYDILLSEDNVGRELLGNHPCVVISNQAKNKYSEKINVVPIEGDGSKIDEMNNIILTNADLLSGYLYKDPSKIIGADIMTVDKARIGVKVGMLKPRKMFELTEMIRQQLDI